MSRSRTAAMASLLLLTATVMSGCFRTSVNVWGDSVGAAVVERRVLDADARAP